MSTIGIIGGTGIYSPDLFEESENIIVTTPQGNVNLIKTFYSNNTIYFLERHGAGHRVAPHNIKYLANINALKMLGVEFIFATAAVGSMQLEMIPGSFVIIDQFLDFTKNRPSTLIDDASGVVHIDMTSPYCPEIRSTLINISKSLNIKTFEAGTYVCTEGPRFENRAEINMYKLLGGDVVGMTNYPEVVLAREANICYGTVAMVTNYATGISKTTLSHKEVMDNMNLMSENIKDLFLKTITAMSSHRNCECKNATKELGNLK
jgi:5'-methylthioadenosine phosphorylase